LRSTMAIPLVGATLVVMDAAIGATPSTAKCPMKTRWATVSTVIAGLVFGPEFFGLCFG